MKNMTIRPCDVPNRSTVGVRRKEYISERTYIDAVKKMSFDADRYLLKGPLPELRKLSKKDLLEECQMWRNVWGWVPSEVKYYVARTGQQIAITQRNYKRYLGVLLDTHWVMDEIELGVFDKIYDLNDGEYYWEKKVIKTKLGAIIDFQIIKERVKEEEYAEPPPEETPPDEDVTEEPSDSQF